MRNGFISVLFFLLASYFLVTIFESCAQIGSPTGGTRDSIAPVLVRASPELRTTGFSGNKIVLTFDEYIEVRESQKNVLVSPLQRNNPNVNFNLRTLTVRLKDTLLPNTTYSIQFGDAIVDVNEGNVLKNFSYVFSTGNTIDSLTLEGKVLMAESGKADSTVEVLLYRNLADSAVQKLRPDYMARLNGDGSFRFQYLPAGSFRLYALKDADGNKYYSQATEIFAFADSAITVPAASDGITLFAYQQEKRDERSTIRVLTPKPDNKLKVSADVNAGQDLLSPLEVIFNNPLAFADTNLLILRDTNNNPIMGGRPRADSIQKTFTYTPVWQPGAAYRLIIPAGAVKDSLGHGLDKADTINFVAKQEKDYARAILRFKNLDLARNPVLQLFVGETLKFSFPLSGNEWSSKRLPPAEYEIRILYDANKDGVWTPGNYETRRQPEKAITIPQKFSLRADWDNERDIEL